tara:strand:- start:44 stop:256 length:213 start_codon:yes stop_codon:yes gene_type:complete
VIRKNTSDETIEFMKTLFRLNLLNKIKEIKNIISNAKYTVNIPLYNPIIKSDKNIEEKSINKEESLLFVK